MNAIDADNLLNILYNFILKLLTELARVLLI